MTERLTGADLDLLPVVADDVMDAKRIDRLYAIYLQAFGPLRTRAAARHLITRDEFFEEMTDPRIRKFSVWRSAEEPMALATITRHVETMPWVSPEFFSSRYPEHAERKAIFYLGLAFVAPRQGQFRVLERVVRETVADCAAAHGVLAYDVCRYNDEAVRFGRRAEAALRRIAPVKVDVADVQTYYEAVFE